MRGRQCYDCLNLRRNAQYHADPGYRARRTRQRDAGLDRDTRNARQRRYTARLRHALHVPIHLKENGPVILPDWFWYLLGHRVVSDYRPEQVNPSSYDTLLADRIKLQVYRGREYPDTPAYLERRRTPGGDTVMMHWRNPYTGLRTSTDLRLEPFLPGDCVLAHLRETFRVPRFVRLQGMLKSSPAREGIDHRAALYVDPAFPGAITLELKFDRSGYLIPDEPIVQFEAQLCLSLKPYRGHYVGQTGVEGNRNKAVAFRTTVTPESVLAQRNVA